MFFPSTASVVKAGRILKWTINLLCWAFAVRIAIGIPWEGWQVLGLFFIKVIVPLITVAVVASWGWEKIRERASPKTRAVLDAAGRGITVMTYMALGAVLYDMWLNHRPDAIVAIIGLALAAVRHWTAREVQRDAK